MRCGRTALLFSVMAAILISCSTIPAARPKPPETQTEEAAIGWEVSPAEGYSDEFGHVGLDFTPPDRLQERSPAAVPAGGRLTVHLGRQDLEHANTAWYSFTVTEGSNTLLDVAGGEGIPNIKGPNGDWWNDIDLDLPRPVFGEINVTIQDRKIGVTYAFTVRRLVRPGSGS